MRTGKESSCVYLMFFWYPCFFQLYVSGFYCRFGAWQESNAVARLAFHDDIARTIFSAISSLRTIRKRVGNPPTRSPFAAPIVSHREVDLLEKNIDTISQFRFAKLKLES